jgi:hypothetical protein
MTRLQAAAGGDAGVFRGLLETIQCLAQPQEVLARPEIPPPFPGPNRKELLDLLTA